MANMPLHGVETLLTDTFAAMSLVLVRTSACSCTSPSLLGAPGKHLPNTRSRIGTAYAVAVSSPGRPWGKDETNQRKRRQRGKNKSMWEYVWDTTEQNEKNRWSLKETLNKQKNQSGEKRTRENTQTAYEEWQGKTLSGGKETSATGKETTFSPRPN